MPTTTKKCNLCHAELRVSNEAQVVECPACGSINSYGYSRSNQNDKYNKGAPSKKNTGVMPNSQNYQQPPLSAAPTQGQAQLHVILLGGTKRPGSLHFVDTNSLFQQPPQASPEYSPPLAIFSWQPQIAPSSQGSLRSYSHGPYQQPLISSPPIAEKTKNSFENPQETAPPKGSPNPSYSNTSNQQPIQSSPQESSHLPQTSSPQGSSPRPSRFSSFLKPRSAQTPPQASSPLAHSDDQKLSQPFSQTSTPPSREDNNGHNKISTPPSSEANNVYSQKPLLGSPQMPASQVQPLLQASVPGTRPVSSSIASAPPLTGERNIRYGTNQGTSGKLATTNSQSADNQNSRNAEAFRGNMTGAPTNYINKPVADADDDPYYTKRRLKEFREELQI